MMEQQEEKEILREEREQNFVDPVPRMIRFTNYIVDWVGYRGNY